MRNYVYIYMYGLLQPSESELKKGGGWQQFPAVIFFEPLPLFDKIHLLNGLISLKTRYIILYSI